ncbi:Hypothetical protein CINCED_3A014073 [Cinara cedri]|uniref:Uncharacterized protein n=1 Tax=Cinara cedri TaxID=506608 RepID=A0A5E4NCF3_9HEMI|nr:Hypothetical protein CINCED_3A014073 [Cinara cedri]
MFTDIDFHPYDISWSDWTDLYNDDVVDPHEDTISDIRKVLDEYASPTYPSSKGYEVTIRQRPAVQDLRPLSPFRRVRRKFHEHDNVAGPSIDYNRCEMQNVAVCNEQDVDNNTHRCIQDNDSGENVAIINSQSVQRIPGPSIDYIQCEMQNVAVCNEQDVNNNTHRFIQDNDSGENVAIINSRKRDEPEQNVPSGE